MTMVSLFEVIEFMDQRMYKAITMEYKNGGVRTVKVWNYDSTDCKTIEYDTRWDSEKEASDK
jgi:hypothetical protein